jgi:hypothetical protein
MTDRELLELAAKAVGNPQGTSKSGGGLLMANGLYWNPLTDDGDALRLAVKLDMQIWRNAGGTVSAMPPKGVIGFWDRLQDDLEPDPYAATRRAIVRAAAEIGKGMK